MVGWGWFFLKAYKAQHTRMVCMVALGGALWCVVESMAYTVHTSLEKSLTQSVVGDYQLLSADALDVLALLGSVSMRYEDHGVIQQSERVRQVLLETGLVEDVVPMGSVLAQVVLPQKQETASLVYAKTLGVDMPRFERFFTTFKTVLGTRVPSGEQGYLFSHRFYEKVIKKSTLREWDALYESVVVQKDTSPRVLERMKRLEERSVSFAQDIGVAHADAMVEACQKMFLDVRVENLATCITHLFKVDIKRFEKHHAFLYRHVVPWMQVYTVPVGDDVVLRSMGKDGYTRTVSVKVYGTFEFEGLESSELTQMQNIADMETWKVLYGAPNAHVQQEIVEMQKNMHLMQAQSAEDFEQQWLRGKKASVRVESKDITDTPWMVHAAVLTRGHQRNPEVQKKLRNALDKNGLGVRLKTWEEVSGVVGDFVVLVQWVLRSVLTGVMCVMALMGYHAMYLAYQERIADMGCMRAMGMQKKTLFQVLMVEAFGVSMLASCVALLLGGAVVLWMHHVGVPAHHQVLRFLFAGPRLFPQTTYAIAASCVAWVVGVVCAAAFSAGYAASGVSPHETMLERE